MLGGKPDSGADGRQGAAEADPHGHIVFFDFHMNIVGGNPVEDQAADDQNNLTQGPVDNGRYDGAALTLNGAENDKNKKL